MYYSMFYQLITREKDSSSGPFLLAGQENWFHFQMIQFFNFSLQNYPIQSHLDQKNPRGRNCCCMLHVSDAPFLRTVYCIALTGRC